mgnify:FL=1
MFSQQVVLDIGARQKDALSVDRNGSLEDVCQPSLTPQCMIHPTVSRIVLGGVILSHDTTGYQMVMT